MNREELKVKYGKERVLCVDTRHFANIDLSNDIIDEYEKLITLYGTYYYRYDVELDQTKKQIIPYVVLKHGDQYMFAKRLKGDSRLVGGLTIGMGGHIDYEDLKLDGVHIDAGVTIDNCIIRELTEETTFDPDGIIGVDRIGAFIDESNEVSSVHACMLAVIELGDTDIQIKETDKLEAQWLKIDDLTDEMYESLEGWSKIAYTELFGVRAYKSKSVAKREKIQKEAKRKQAVQDTQTVQPEQEV